MFFPFFFFRELWLFRVQLGMVPKNRLSRRKRKFLGRTGYGFLFLRKILVPGLLVTYFFSRVEGSALDRTTKAKPWSDIPIKKLFGLDAEFQIENY